MQRTTVYNATKKAVLIGFYCLMIGSLSLCNALTIGGIAMKINHFLIGAVFALALPFAASAD
jgi:hypothetical protein